MLQESISLGNRIIGPYEPVYIIAEAGVNHNGSVEIANQLVKAAKESGADCIKFQTFKAERVVTRQAPKAAYQLEVTDKAESQLDMLRKLELDFDAYQQIIATCKMEGIDFLSTPYNDEDADFLDELDVSGFKIASGQLVELDFLRYVAKKGKVMVVSTGMGSMAEVADAVDTIRSTGNDKLIVLQCTTNYPSKIEEANIRAMNTMGEALAVLTGYSDHVPSNLACYAAVARGAVVVEKHFTLDRNMEGPDHSSSLEPAGFKELVTGIRHVEAALGSGLKEPTLSEQKNTVGMRRSLVLKGPLKAGTVLEAAMLTAKRPGNGIAPKMKSIFLGKRLKHDKSNSELLNWDDIDW